MQLLGKKQFRKISDVITDLNPFNPRNLRIFLFLNIDIYIYIYIGEGWVVPESGMYLTSRVLSTGPRYWTELFFPFVSDNKLLIFANFLMHGGNFRVIYVKASTTFLVFVRRMCYFFFKYCKTQ